ncbi:hypothetical protein RSOLAG1IB_07453 [Rhizoctonia solani AG-1 IB]|uniref:C2H2-type domain-containing protein n=1 Tax=Thanatephorus cucumeris (strain AG1-IB / isolate 7/3/14) TaxID=1108050 RepID=A0A0B7FA60_THACB|nr:hypothetical protein RSOLAG1IB_07453 [Rhizoctonia solani AG-1 IB]
MRHFHMHTGERNHKCPYPGCTARCSRADNLQQHYQTHFVIGSRHQMLASAVAAAAGPGALYHLSYCGPPITQRRRNSFPAHAGDQPVVILHTTSIDNIDY